MKLTPWFNGATHKPARVGVYMLHNGSGTSVGYQYWHGDRWGSWEQTPDDAFRVRSYIAASQYQNDAWRGLAEKP